MPRPRLRIRSLAAGTSIVGVLLICLLGSGCAYVAITRHWIGAISTGADVSRVSDNPHYVSMTFANAVCGEDPYVDTSVWMTDISTEELMGGQLRHGQILHVEMLFEPKAGWTPIDSTATNLAIRYILIADGEVGLYEGGGFGYPIGSGRSSSMTLRIEKASLQLSRSTPGFIDLLTPAELNGTFSGPCDTTELERIRNVVNQYMTNTFGEVLYVRIDDGLEGALDSGTSIDQLLAAVSLSP